MSDIQAGDLIEYVGPAKVPSALGFIWAGWVAAPERGAIRTCVEIRRHPVFESVEILPIGEARDYWQATLWRKVYRPRPEIFAGVLTSALTERVADDGVPA